MIGDLQRFLRAVRTLSKLAHKYDEEAFQDALGRYATVKQEGEVWHVGTFLVDIGRELSSRRCRVNCQCGREISNNLRYDNRDPRTDAKYCSPACRQRAYRNRVTANTTNPQLKCDGHGAAVTSMAANATASRNANPAEGSA